MAVDKNTINQYEINLLYFALFVYIILNLSTSLAFDFDPYFISLQLSTSDLSWYIHCS